MSYTDPVEPGVTEVQSTYDPVSRTKTVIKREARSDAGWWVTGVVLVVAIVAMAVVFASRGPAPDSTATAAALAPSNAQTSRQPTQAADAAASRARAAAAARAADETGQPLHDTVPPRTLPPNNSNPPD